MWRHPFLARAHPAVVLVVGNAKLPPFLSAQKDLRSPGYRIFLTYYTRVTITNNDFTT